MTDMLDTDVYALFDVAVTDDLVYNNPNRMRSHIVYDARTTVVKLVRHALLLCSIRFDIDNVANTVVDEERGQFDGTVF